MLSNFNPYTDDLVQILATTLNDTYGEQTLDNSWITGKSQNLFSDIPKFVLTATVCSFTKEHLGNIVWHNLEIKDTRPKGIK